ncbi:MAG: type I methionyl aminopeptidase [Bacteroidales bacterium]|nr:type I methionyl aminopeptidase [Bacteroidales bacterium]MDD3913939.1 type I methionyl aminopeptidase [Bacteroidales bacterium]MDD4634222.1 type I methionyl aminopeptidase [Bacteroidales bacterium]
MYLKNDQEIDLLKKCSLLVGKTLAEVAKEIRPGVTTKYLDKLGETFIRDNGALPAFLNYEGYPASLCISINDTVVHGIPNDKTIIKDGDIVSVDCGTIIDGWYGDSAYTFEVGEVKEEVRQLLKVTRESLELGIEKAIVGNRLGDIGYAVQTHAEKYGYSVVRDLVGHGIGRNMHEEPEIPNYGKRGTGPKLKEGMVICIEPMINMGTWRIKISRDGWTVKTLDGQPSAHYEKQLAVRKGKAEVLTSYSEINEVLKSKNG